MLPISCSLIYSMQSQIHSTWSSIASGLLYKTDGLCGPVIGKEQSSASA
jgi:hypothetical protein